MKRFAAVGLLVCSIHAYAADEPVIDAEAQAFSAYISDVSRLDGMFHGVMDYCQPLVPHLIVEQSKAAWQQHNGQYIDAVDVAIERFTSATVEPDRKAAVIRQLKENAGTWFQAAHDQSKLRDELRAAHNKGGGLQQPARGDVVRILLPEENATGR